jgi:type VI secretion system secreted protein Hcp
MALDAFLKFEGPEIKGNSLDEAAGGAHKDELHLMSYSWGLSNPGSTHEGPGSGTAKANVQDVHCTMLMDRAWPNLVKFSQNGKHFEKATLYARRAGGDQPVTYKKLEMEDVLISSVQDGASSDDSSVVSFSLNFGRYKLTYTPQKADGTSDAEIVTGWDIAANKDNS